MSASKELEPTQIIGSVLDSNPTKQRGLLEALDVGVAIFDSNYNLVEFNDIYKNLCGYTDEELYVGTNLRDLIKISLTHQSMTEEVIESTIKTSLQRIEQGVQKFNFRTRGGNTITINRCLDADGSIVETVQHLKLEIGKKDESALEQIARLAHARMMITLDAIGDGFAVYDANDCLVVYNQKFVELMAEVDDLIKPGVSFAEIKRAAISRGMLKENGMSDDELFDMEMEQHRNPGKTYERQLANGRWVRVVEKRTEDGGTAGIRSDITELKNRELEVRRISGELNSTSTQFDVALNNMIQGLCMFDEDQKLILCNRQYLEMYGFSSDVVKPGIQLADIMKYSISLGNYNDTDAEAALKARHNKTKLSKRTTIKQFLRDGRVIAVMNEPMEGGGTIATYQDITKSERDEERVRAYTEKLKRSNQELQEFAYVASHDLQEPLRKIEAFGDRLAKKYADILPDDGKLFVDRMQNAAHRMRELINDLLSYSRVSTKAKPYEKVNLNKIIDGVASDLQVRLQEINGKMDVAELPILDGDPIQMRQLFQNLISNALKFKRPDVDPVVRIWAEEHIVDDHNKNQTKYWRIKLSDNGIGFDNKYKDQIFTIFQRLHGRLEYEGTGIGLATVRKIIERHNGMIDADGVPNEGATFIIDLPEVQKNIEEI